MSPITSSFMRRPKKPTAAFTVSLLIPGAGQIYNREVLKGALLFLIAAGFLIWTASNLLTHDAIFRQIMEHTSLEDIARRQARASVPYPYAPLLFYGLVALYSALDGWSVARQIVAFVDKGSAPPPPRESQ